MRGDKRMKTITKPNESISYIVEGNEVGKSYQWKRRKNDTNYRKGVSCDQREGKIKFIVNEEFKKKSDRKIWSVHKIWIVYDVHSRIIFFFKKQANNNKLLW